MKRKTKILAITLAVLFCASLPFPAVLADTLMGTCGEDAVYRFESETGTLYVSGTGTASLRETEFYAQREAVLRIEIDDGVTELGENAFSNFRNVQEIFIPDSVTEIRPGAFFRCASLTDLMLPPKLTRLENHLFHGCDKLVSVTIPAGVTSIGDMVFEGCNSLRDVYFQGSKAQWEQIHAEDFSWALVYSTVHFEEKSTAPPDWVVKALGIYPGSLWSGTPGAPFIRPGFLKFAMFLLSEQRGC